MKAHSHLITYRNNNKERQMKASKSARNRHTGRINSITAMIIKKGKKLVAKDGTEYMGLNHGKRNGLQLVRAPIS